MVFITWLSHLTSLKVIMIYDLIPAISKSSVLSVVFVGTCLFCYWALYNLIFRCDCSVSMLFWDVIELTVSNLLLSFLDPDRNIGHQQHQLSTELLTGPVVSNQARFCLDSCTPFPQFVFTSRRVSPFFSQYYPGIPLHSLSGHWRLTFS